MLFGVRLKDQFLGHYYLTLIYVIRFTILMVYILQVLLMTVLYFFVYQTWYLFLDSLKEVLIKYLIDLQKTFLKKW